MRASLPYFGPCHRFSAVLAPIAGGSRAQQNDRTRGDVDVQCALDVRDGDFIGRRRAFTFLRPATSTKMPRDDRRDRRHVGLAKAEVAAPLLRRETVVKLILRSMRDVASVATLSFMKIALLC
jgi:hypothetical protein